MIRFKTLIGSMNRAYDLNLKTQVSYYFSAELQLLRLIHDPCNNRFLKFRFLNK